MEVRMPRMSTQLRQISLEYPNSELTAATLNWHQSRRLGSGSYGAVYKGELEDGSEVAIKAIDLAALGAAGQSAEMAGFDEEVQMLSKFRHPNLVTLLGWGRHNLQRYLVYELLAGGDCFQRLQKSKHPSGMHPFHWWERLSVLLDSATGLSHMHNSKPKAFHRDIKSANILLDRHGTAKMADFGLSCTSNAANSLHVTVRTISGTPGYACPIYSRTGRVTEGSEVYSFGMVALELLSGLAPAAADPKCPGRIIYHINDVLAPNKHGAMDRCMRGLDPSATWPAQPANELATLVLKCVNEFDESQRPNFVTIVRTIRALIERFPKPSAVPATLSSQMPQVPQHLMGGAYAQNPQQHAAPQNPQQQGGQVWVAPAAPAAAAASPPPVKAASSVDAPYVLELTMAVGLDPSAMTPDKRTLPLVPSAGTVGDVVVPVGRQHQPEYFEAWIPDENLRGCISRVAFEVIWTTNGDHLLFKTRGANPVSVDGRVVGRDTAVALRLGSEIAFTYSSSGEQSVFLQLRLLPGSRAPGGGTAIRMVPSSAKAISVTPVAAPVAVVQEPPPSIPMAPPAPKVAAPAPAAAKAFEPPARAAPSPAVDKPQDHVWCLRCIHAEKVSATRLAALPPEHRSLVLQAGMASVGRQHQPQLFEVLLAEASSCLSFISRTHVQLTPCAGSGLNATNMSSNPLYVDREHLAKGESRTLTKDQVLSFARLENGSHVYFLQFQVATQPAEAQGDFLKRPDLQPVVQQGTASARPPASASGLYKVPVTIDARGGSPERRTPGLANEGSPGRPPPMAYSATPPAAASSPSPADAPGAAGGQEVTLELFGDGVTDVPPSERSIGPVSLAEPLYVGRKHQPELHRRAVTKDCLQFLSRDHFRIAFEDGEFKMLVMTSNPMWRDRDGALSNELTKGDVISVMSGDKIALGTGGEDVSQHSLCWLFRVVDQRGQQGKGAAAESSFEPMLPPAADHFSGR